MVDSAKVGTYIAPLGATLALIFYSILGCYALSGAQLIRKLPLLKFGIYTIATVCIMRGLLPLQLWLRKPEKVSEVALYIGLVWLIAGLLYLFGFRGMRKLNC